MKHGAVGRDLEAALDRLRAYRRQDPAGERWLAAAMDAEAEVEDDPAKGVHVPRVRAARPVSTRVLERLGG